MSNIIIIRAADSSLAMDEVVRQLGPDALILSTTRRNGMVEIEATLEEEDENSGQLEAGKTEAPPASAADSKSLLETAQSTFEALLKRRLEEDKVDALITSARQSAEGMTPLDPTSPPLPEPETDLGPAPEIIRPTPEPAPQARPEQMRDPVPETRPDLSAAQVPPREPVQERPEPESRVTGLGDFDIPLPHLASPVFEAVQGGLALFARRF